MVKSKQMNPVIKVENLEFKYNKEIVLDAVSLTIGLGEYVAIIGENGSGKSSLIKIILGINKFKKGRVEIFGQDISDYADWHSIGYLPQGSGQKIGDMPITVNEVIENGWQKKSGINKKEAIKNVVDLVGINDILQNQLSDLSGGQRQRVFIARSLVNRPKILILDEPTSGIDVESRNSLFDFLEYLSTETDISIIHITHDLDGFGRIVDRTLCINKRVLCEEKHNIEHIHK